MAFYTDLLSSKRNGTLYARHTDDMSNRIGEHKAGKGAAFTRKYAVHMLVWFEAHETREGAKRREYQIKKWNRDWKLRLIEEGNPDWKDLYFDLNNLIGFDSLLCKALAFRRHPRRRVSSELKTGRMRLDTRLRGYLRGWRSLFQLFSVAASPLETRPLPNVRSVRTPL